MDPPSPAPGLAPRLSGNQEPQVQELTDPSFTPHSSGGARTKMEVWAGLVPPESSLLGVETVTFLPCLLVALLGVSETKSLLTVALS